MPMEFVCFSLQPSVFSLNTERGSSYMAVMLNVTDAVDGFSFIPNSLSYHFPLQNRSIALAVSAGILWHVSCDVSY